MYEMHESLLYCENIYDADIIIPITTVTTLMNIVELIPQ